MNSYGNKIKLLPLQIRTTYAELLDRLEDLEAGNAMAGLVSCGLIVKRVRAREFLYAQGRVADGTVRQVYLGPYDERRRSLFERFNQSKEAAADEKVAIETMAKSLRAAGMMSLDPVEWRVVAALTEEGIFRLGGVLVGTIAFRCISNLLGAKLPSASAMTADVDIAGRTVPVGIAPEVVCPLSALERLEMGFSPMMEIDPALHGSRFKAREGEFKVEFLTPLVGRDTGKSIVIRQLDVAAVPLRFLDYLMEESVPAVALGRRPVLVRVPSPYRYAVHKLIVSRERPRSLLLKSQKDLQQSFEIQRVLLRVDPGGLEEAFEDARVRGPGWAKRVDDGQAALIKLYGTP